MSHGIDHIVHPETVTDHGIELGIAPIRSVFPTVADVHVEVDQYHQAVVIIEDSQTMRVAAIIFEGRVAQDWPQSWYLGVVIEIKVAVEDRMIGFQLDRRPVGENFAEFIDEILPLRAAVKIINHQEASTQAPLAQGVGLLLGKLQVADLQDISKRIIEKLRISERDRQGLIADRHSRDFFEASDEILLGSRVIDFPTVGLESHSKTIGVSARAVFQAHKGEGIVL